MTEEQDDFGSSLDDRLEHPEHYAQIGDYRISSEEVYAYIGGTAFQKATGRILAGLWGSPVEDGFDVCLERSRPRLQIIRHVQKRAHPERTYPNVAAMTRLQVFPIITLHRHPATPQGEGLVPAPKDLITIRELEGMQPESVEVILAPFSQRRARKLMIWAIRHILPAQRGPGWAWENWDAAVGRRGITFTDIKNLRENLQAAGVTLDYRALDVVTAGSVSYNLITLLKDLNLRLGAP